VQVNCQPPECIAQGCPTAQNIVTLCNVDVEGDGVCMCVLVLCVYVGVGTIRHHHTPSPYAIHHTPSGLHFECPAGSYIGYVRFASYGNPEGTCGAYSVGQCHQVYGVWCMVYGAWCMMYVA